MAQSLVNHIHIIVDTDGNLHTTMTYNAETNQWTFTGSLYPRYLKLVDTINEFLARERQSAKGNHIVESK